jgi:hypothetical protein
MPTFAEAESTQRGASGLVRRSSPADTRSAPSSRLEAEAGPPDIGDERAVPERSAVVSEDCVVQVLRLRDAAVEALCT